MAITKLNLANGVTGVLPGANGGGLVKISTTTIGSSVANVQFDGSFSSTYKKYLFVATNIQISSNAGFYFRVMQSAASKSDSAYTMFGGGYDGGSTFRSSGGDSSTFIAPYGNASNSSASHNHNWTVWVNDPLGTNNYKILYGQAGDMTDQTTSSIQNGIFAGAYESASALSGISFETSNAATFDSGEITMFGVAR